MSEHSIGISIIVVALLSPWILFQGVKLSRYAWLRGEELFHKSKSKKDRSES